MYSVLVRYFILYWQKLGLFFVFFSALIALIINDQIHSHKWCDSLEEWNKRNNEKGKKLTLGLIYILYKKIAKIQFRFHVENDINKLVADSWFLAAFCQNEYLIKWLLVYNVETNQIWIASLPKKCGIKSTQRTHHTILVGTDYREKQILYFPISAAKLFNHSLY